MQSAASKIASRSLPISSRGRKLNESTSPPSYCFPMRPLALREARRHIRSFADESELLPELGDGAHSFDGEAFLQVGIDAYHWFVRADETIRLAVYRELVAHDPRIDEALQALARAWVTVAGAADRHIVLHAQRGASLANLAEFRRCEAEMRAIVRSLDADELTDPMRALRDSAIEEHRRGETAEFV